MARDSLQAVDDAALRELCKTYALDLLANLDSRPGVVLARVQDQDGRVRVLKRGAASQLAALRTWLKTEGVVRVDRELDDGLYLMGLLNGPTLAELLFREPANAEAMGKLLRDLHAVPAPAGTPMLRWGAREWLRLTDVELEFAAGLAERLHSHTDEALVLLHGDLVPSNIVQTPECLVVIDPVGLRGPRAWDLATLHVATIGRGGPAVLPGLLAGYGAVPRLIDEFVCGASSNSWTRTVMMAEPNSFATSSHGWRS
jgi:Ser/Thr protein kinase RdoA (MazF antagonist)